MTQNWGGQEFDEQPAEHHAYMCAMQAERKSVFGRDGYIAAREEVASVTQREPLEAEVLQEMLLRAQDYFCA